MGVFCLVKYLKRQSASNEDLCHLVSCDVPLQLGDQYAFQLVRYRRYLEPM